MNRPYFSVLTPSFNQAPWIEGCIQSVLAQSVSDFEHIVFDNCSTDGTREILERHPHLIWKSEPDHGQAHAINQALRLARGEVICWLNADDQYLPGSFETVRRELSKPGVDVIFGDALEDFCDGRPPTIRKARFPGRDDMLIWWEKRVDILQPAVFFKRSALADAGELREDLHLVLDTELWWRLSERHEFHYVPVPLALQQRQPESKTVRAVHRIYEEKAKVFDPLLHRAHPAKWLQHTLARRRGMGRRYLGLAQSAARVNAAAAKNLLVLSLRENPLLLLTVRWWKAHLFLSFQRRCHSEWSEAESRKLVESPATSHPRSSATPSLAASRGSSTAPGSTGLHSE